MDLKKLLLVAVAALFLATPAFAGNVPEFDAVGCDATNYFALANEVPYGLIIDKNIDFFNDKVNCFSDFTGGSSSVDAATQAVLPFRPPEKLYLFHRLILLLRHQKYDL